MIDLTTLAAYGMVVLGFVFIPGPATLLTVARATSSGTKVGIATGVGIAAGDMIHTFMAIVGISAIIATSALLVQHHQIHWRSVSRLPRHSCHS
jgi:threonine/homoserine/homoserine lactone efflux protein